MDFNYLKRTDVRLRNSIVEVYGRKCFYCGREIDVNTLEIDHIIPVNGKNEISETESEDYEQYLFELMNEGFEIDCLINYLPSCGNCNKKKGNEHFTVGNLRYFHGYTRKKRSKLIEAIKSKSYMKPSEEVSQKNEVEIERIQESNELLVEKQVLDSFNTTVYVNGFGKARVDAHIPNNFKSTLNCLMSFAEPGVENCMITLDEDDITRLFFNTNNLGVCDERPFITYIKGEIVGLQFPNVRFRTDYETAEQLADLFDDLYGEFQKRLTQFRNTVGGSNFVEIERGKFKIAVLPQSIWMMIKQFTYDHDQMYGDTKWHTFYPVHNNKLIRIYKNHNLKFDADVLAELRANEVNSNFVEVIWEPGYKGYANDPMDDFDDIVKWTVLFTHDWLLYELIPYVLFDHKSKHKEWSFRDIFRRKETLDSFIKDFKLENYYIESLKIED